MELLSEAHRLAVEKKKRRAQVRHKEADAQAASEVSAKLDDKSKSKDEPEGVNQVKTDVGSIFEKFYYEPDNHFDLDSWREGGPLDPLLDDLLKGEFYEENFDFKNEEIELSGHSLSSQVTSTVSGTAGVPNNIVGKLDSELGFWGIHVWDIWWGILGTILLLVTLMVSIAFGRAMLDLAADDISTTEPLR
ncbi:hypothetical protein CEUSTIGMA_g1542.t1 [Chlamydomonas eustigma]|uniref:Uncharacterized protein n=1 Tax=Chlamydomonas eustigma TaxID=1157962 RepID=A0A250WTX7_9CHLO|nr:hypothetical protein CEUSTIGMA_g1542.t1 [Chlamydomonas eustigma]|eukprot:GAX74092.1 hypothetical protein CEUSTIGMA_g1542.t1 [Chlamydomonas eustigma]